MVPIQNNLNTLCRKGRKRSLSPWPVLLLLATGSPLFAQFTLNTPSLPAPNNTIPIKLTGTADGYSSGTFTLGGVIHALSYNSQAKLFELDLISPAPTL